MNILIASGLFFLFLFTNEMGRFAQAEFFELTLRDAEIEAIRSSNLLKSFTSDAEAAAEQANSQYTLLLPRLTLEGFYRDKLDMVLYFH